MIKEPFMSLAASEPEAVYITFNKGEVYIPSAIAGKSIGVDGDIGEALKEICLARENLQGCLYISIQTINFSEWTMQKRH